MRFSSSKVADAVEKALRPDNRDLPTGLKLFSRRRGATIRMTLQHSENIETLIATTDEIIAHTEIAVNALDSPRE
jgi:hypothetical protein